ncbi:MAG: hypothetical protein MK008_10335 [Bdellovibrionales bacterium]|nr:hypothetical protein [Bdellovibrionales bacterium]
MKKLNTLCSELINSKNLEDQKKTVKELNSINNNTLIFYSSLKLIESLDIKHHIRFDVENTKELVVENIVCYSLQININENIDYLKLKNLKIEKLIIKTIHGSIEELQVEKISFHDPKNSNSLLNIIYDKQVKAVKISSQTFKGDLNLNDKKYININKVDVAGKLTIQRISSDKNSIRNVTALNLQVTNVCVSMNHIDLIDPKSIFHYVGSSLKKVFVKNLKTNEIKLNLSHSGKIVFNLFEVNRITINGGPDNGRNYDFLLSYLVLENGTIHDCISLQNGTFYKKINFTNIKYSNYFEKNIPIYQTNKELMKISENYELMHYFHSLEKKIYFKNLKKDDGFFERLIGWLSREINDYGLEDYKPIKTILKLSIFYLFILYFGGFKGSFLYEYILFLTGPFKVLFNNSTYSMEAIYLILKVLLSILVSILWFFQVLTIKRKFGINKM